MPDKQVKNLIFDLGGVILDLSVDHTLQAFSDLSGMEKDKVQKTFHSEKGFELYEKGLMDDKAFRNFVRKTYDIEHTDDAIDKSWNAMLRGIPVKKLDLLLDLQKHYRVFLLSNTNSIHIHHIHTEMLPRIVGNRLLDDYFHRAYYSHIMKKRKPDAEIFDQVLEENNLVPEHTIFLDDNLQNIEGAQALGIKTFHVTSPDLIFDYFHD